MSEEKPVVDPVEEGRLAVKSLTEKINYIMRNVPEQLTEVYQKLKLADDDVIIVGYPKSGTNWMEQICHQIKMLGTDEEFEELTNEVPLFDVFGPLSGSDLQKTQKGDFKLFKSHYTFEQLPECSKNAKFVVIIREPHNTFASFYQWAIHFEWDLAPFADNITVEDFYDGKIADPHAMYPVAWWNFLESWLINHKQVNSIIVCYEDLVRDFSSQLERIAAFLEVSLSDAEKSRVTHLSSFEYMKANNHKFDLHTLRETMQKNIDDIIGYLSPRTQIPPFISKGSGRKGKEELSETVKADTRKKWEDIIEAKFNYKNYEEMIQSLKEFQL